MITSREGHGGDGDSSVGDVGPTYGARGMLARSAIFVSDISTIFRSGGRRG